MLAWCARRQAVAARRGHMEINVNVSGGGSNPAENTDLTKKIATQITPAMREMMLFELRTQMRPGGMFNR